MLGTHLTGIKAVGAIEINLSSVITRLMIGLYDPIATPGRYTKAVLAVFITNYADLSIAALRQLAAVITLFARRLLDDAITAERYLSCNTLAVTITDHTVLFPIVAELCLSIAVITLFFGI